MSTCPHCQATIQEGYAFCTACGKKLSEAPQQGNPVPQQQAASRPVGKLHCPQCGSHNFSAVTESSVNGAVSTHHGSFSSTHVSNTHRNYWMCADCGTKFRNLQNLEEEIAKSKKNPIIFAVLGVIAAVLSIYWFIEISSNPLVGLFVGVYAVAAAVSALLFLIVALVSNNQLKKMKVEWAYLKQNCFN